MGARVMAARGWRGLLAATLTAGMALAVGLPGVGAAAAGGGIPSIGAAAARIGTHATARRWRPADVGWTGRSTDVAAVPGFSPYETVPAGRTLYLPGTGACGTTECQEMYRTADDGARWSRVTEPRSAPDGPTSTVFADARDGYAMVTTRRSVPWGTDERLERTTDGAARWARIALPGHPTVFQMTGSGGDFYAVVADCTATTCHDGRLLHALRGGPVESTRLPAAAEPPGLDKYGPGALTMAAWGAKVWLYIDEPDAAHPHPLTLVSTDGGARLRRQDDRLPASLGCGLTASSRSVLWAGCSGGMMMTEWRSADGGRAYTEVHLPELPGTGGAMVAVVSPSLAYVYRGLSAQRLLVTTDGGRTFTTAGRFPLPASGNGDLAFTGAERGLMIRSGTRTARESIERTTDGGRQWTRVPLP